MENRLSEIKKEIDKQMTPDQKKEYQKATKKWNKEWKDQQIKHNNRIGEWFRFFDTRFTTSQVDHLKILVKQDEINIFNYVAAALNIRVSPDLKLVSDGGVPVVEGATPNSFIVKDGVNCYEVDVNLSDWREFWNRIEKRFPTIVTGSYLVDKK